MSSYKISLEEVEENNGWHLLGYNWSTRKYLDLMGGHGVTGTKNACCGWAVVEFHDTPGASCKFDAAFPVGAHLVYDTKKRVLLNGSWITLDKVPGGGFTSSLKIDCVDISGTTDASDVSPYFSGEYFAAPANGEFGPEYAGSFWLTQR